MSADRLSPAASAFLQRMVREYLQLFAHAQTQALRERDGGPALLRCLGVGFYSFVAGNETALPPTLATRLTALACRVEAACLHPLLGNWAVNAEQASTLLEEFFPDAGPRPPVPRDAPPSGPGCGPR